MTRLSRLSWAVQPLDPSLLAQRAHLPTVILDLDETLLYRKGGWVERVKLYAVPESLVGQPYPSAHSSSCNLSNHFRFAAVTARNAYAKRNTLHWLRAHGFGGVPVVHTDSVFAGDGGRDSFKADAIRELCATGWNPCIAGIGDRPSDMKAYISSGLHAIMVIHSTPGLDAAADGAAGLAAFRKLSETARTLDAQQLGAVPAAAAHTPLAHLPVKRRITYVSDVSAVHREGQADPSLVGTVYRPPCGSPSSTHTASDSSNKQNGANERPLPPVWKQIETLLMQEVFTSAAVSKVTVGQEGPAARGQASGGQADHWEEEATASWYVADRPADYGTKDRWR